MNKGKTFVILFLLLAVFMGIEGPLGIENDQSFIAIPEPQEVREFENLDQYHTSDDPQVVIIGNSDFVDQNWPGAGTAENPYRIENLTITDPDMCIYIEDTDVHFIIRNCTFSGDYWDTYGVRLDNVTNGVVDSCDMSDLEGGITCYNVVDVSIENCSISGCMYTGLYLSGQNCTVQNNTISQINNGNGIAIYDSYNITVKSNLIQNNSGGLSLSESILCNVTENEFVNDGLFIYDNYGNENYWYHYITSNTVDGRDLGYFWNTTDSIIAGDYGSLILANCTNVTIIDSAMQNTDTGILLGHSSGCTVENATFTNVMSGVYNFYSSNTTISSMVSSCTMYDVYASESPYLILKNSTLDSGGYGLYGMESESSQVINNTISSSVGAISFRYSDDLLLDNNTIVGIGAYLYDCQNVDIFNNTIISEQHYGIRSQTNLNLRVIGNEFHGCGLDVEGDMSSWNHEIRSNSVNGKPLLYYWGATNLTIDSLSCNQVIFANCLNISFNDFSISNTSIGIQAAFSSNYSLSEIRLSDCDIGVRVEDSVDAKISDVTLHRCDTGIYVQSVDNSTISNVNATENLESITVGGAFNISLVNCSIISSFNEGMVIGNSEVIWIENCSIQESSDGIYTSDCKNCTIIDSKFLNNYQGCDLDGDFLTMVNNTVSGNNDGVQIYDSDYCNITFNIISENEDEGLRMRYSDYCTVSNNTIERNWVGLELYDLYIIGVFNNSFRYNGYGLTLDYVYNASVIDNLVYLCSQNGINVHSDSVNNTFYSNRIGGRVDSNAFDYGLTNSWDNGIDTGNAWSDFTGSPTYAILGSAGSVDHYPTLFEDNAAPEIDHPDDVEYELGTSSSMYVTWYPLDISPESYEIFMDDVLIENDDWDGNYINVRVDALPHGLHNFTLRVTDDGGLSSSDTVFVNVWTTPGALVISSNSDFVARGFTGSGTPTSPYVMSGLTLKLNGTCVYVFDTDAYFDISNFNISSDGIIGGYGIILNNVDHGTVSFCSISGKEFGIYGADADSCTITGNEVYANSLSGIYLDGASYDNTVSYNEVHENGWDASLLGGMYPGGGIVVAYRTDIIGNYIYDNDLIGVHVGGYSQCLITDNTLVGNGFFLSQYSNHGFLHNTVNGKAFGYLTGLTNTIVDASIYGQLYLMDCVGVSIINADFNDATVGLWMEECSDCVIENSSFSFNSIIGAIMFDSYSCTIRNCRIFGNEWIGLMAQSSDFANISQNAVVGNSYNAEGLMQMGGISLLFSDNCDISSNLVFNNTGRGIELSGVSGGDMIGNSIGSNNGTGVVLSNGVDEWNVYNNKLGWNSEDNAIDSNIGDNIWDDNQDQGNYWSDHSGTGTYTIPPHYSVVDRYPTILTDSGFPTLSAISDFEYELEHTPLMLEWDVSDENPASFMLYRNGSLIDYGAWTNGPLQIEVPNSGPGVYEFTLAIYDLAMNSVNDSVIITITDTTAPEWSTTPENQYVEFGYNLQYQALASDNHQIDHYSINDTIRFSIDSEGNVRNMLPLEIGRYGVHIEAHDSSGFFCTADFTVFVQDTTGPIWVQTPVDQQIWEEESFRYDLNATDLSGVDSWGINDTIHFTINQDGVVTNQVTLELGTYSLQIAVSDTLGNIRIAVFTVTVREIIVTTTTTTTTTTSTTTNTTTTSTTSLPPLDPVILSFVMVGGIIGIVIVIVYVGRRKGRI
ncbi:MAG: NosD domain-containing protein [Candidatus Thorarchaeota archaeon]